MAIFRKIHVTFWSDPFTSELNNDRKLFYLYLLTNERTKQCGIYEISKRQISFDLGYSIDTVSILLKYFIKIGKIQYSDSTNEIAIKNWKKFNYSTSPKVVKCIESELKLVKNRVLIEYINSIDTLSQEEQEQEEEKEEEQEEELPLTLDNDFNLFWNKYNKKIDSKKCKDKFKKLSKIQVETILKVVDSYVAATSDVQYRKNPLTWLNGECWKDVEVNTFLPTKDKPFGKSNQL